MLTVCDNYVNHYHKFRWLQETHRQPIAKNLKQMVGIPSKTTTQHQKTVAYGNKNPVLQILNFLKTASYTLAGYCSTSKIHKKSHLHMPQMYTQSASQIARMCTNTSHMYLYISSKTYFLNWVCVCVHLQSHSRWFLGQHLPDQCPAFISDLELSQPEMQLQLLQL